MTGPAAPPVPAELETLTRRMRLPYLRKAAPDVLATARAQRRDPAEVLRVLLAEEVTGRDAATRRMRRRAAGFPSGKTFSSWRPDQSSISAATQDAQANTRPSTRTSQWPLTLAVAGPNSHRSADHLGYGLVPARVGRRSGACSGRRLQSRRMRRRDNIAGMPWGEVDSSLRLRTGWRA